MRTSVEPLEGNKVKLSVGVDEQDFNKAVDETFRRIAREVRIPGFRPGKAPRKLIEARLGKDGLRQETLRDALPSFYAQALRETDVDAIAPPDIDITGGEETGDLTFDAVVEVRPQISVPGYTGLQVTIPSPIVSDEDVETQVDRLRRSFGELQLVEREARDGDHVTLSISGSRDDEPVEGLTADDYLYEVGSEGIVAELDEQLRGAKVGDILQFDATFGGSEVAFRVLVKEVKELVLPEATDEWASEASEFATVDELRADLRTRLAGLKKMQANLAIRDKTVDALVEMVADDPPETLVSAEMERRLHDLSHRLAHQNVSLAQWVAATGQNQQEFVDNLRESSVSAVKADLALRAVAEAENLVVTEEDLDEEIARAATEAEQDAIKIREELDRNGQMPAVRSDLRKAKALKWLVEHVDVVDEDGKSIDRAELEPDEPSDEPSEEADVNNAAENVE